MDFYMPLPAFLHISSYNLFLQFPTHYLFIRTLKKTEK